MAKKIEWLDQFANDQYNKMTKTASQKKVANQIIVNRSAYPNAKIGTLVDYDNNKYKVVDTKYRDKSGPGLLLEEVTACGSSPTCTGEIQTNNGIVPPTSEVKTPGDNGVKTAAKKDFDLDFDALANFDDSKSDDNDDDFDNVNDDLSINESTVGDSAATMELSGNTGYSEYPDTITRPGGNKPIASTDIEGPGKKNITDAPYHPTYDPGEQYALESLDEWQTAADRTAAAIKQEDEQDRTTVEGHYTWNQYIDAILDDNPSDALLMTDAEIPADDDEDLDTDTDMDMDMDTDMDMGTDETEADDVDDVDNAVDNMLDLDSDSNDEDTDEDNLDLDENIPDTDISDTDNEDFDTSIDENFDEDIPEDFSSEDSSVDMNENEDFDLDENEDFDLDEDIPEEEPKMASNQSKSKPLSRLAFKNQ